MYFIGQRRVCCFIGSIYVENWKTRMNSNREYIRLGFHFLTSREPF